LNEIPAGAPYDFIKSIGDCLGKLINPVVQGCLLNDAEWEAMKGEVTVEELDKEVSTVNM